MILVVDDEAGIRELLSLLLVAWGYQVEVASDGRHALSLLERQMFDLVISDVRMPRLRGDALAREVRARWSHVPVVLMTGYDDIERGSEDAAVVVLHKPIPPGTLRQVVQDVLAR